MNLFRCDFESILGTVWVRFNKPIRLTVLVNSLREGHISLAWEAQLHQILPLRNTSDTE